MSAMHSTAFHLARRGVEAARSHFQAASPDFMEKLNLEAQLYDQSGPENEVKPEMFIPFLVTGILVLLLVASIDYTLGSVVASLTMIESPSSTAIVEPKQAPPPYADEPDAPLFTSEKETLLPSEVNADADVEITVINHKPITAQVKTSIRHLHQVGGFGARWRGLGHAIGYHFLHSLMSNALGHLLGFGIIGSSLLYVFSSVALARVHMLWTHAMIAAPTHKDARNRFVPRKQCKALLIPTLVHAVAQQATVLLPVAVAFALNLPELHKQQFSSGPADKDCHMAVLALKVLAVPATALIVSLGLLLPAAGTLARIEATLLPEGMATIVPFDREAIVGEVDTAVRGGSRALFAQAWRSFDRSARLRVIKLYIKSTFAQLAILFIGAHIMLAELYVIGGEKLTIFFTSVHAQLRLMVIEAQQARIDAQ